MRLVLWIVILASLSLVACKSKEKTAKTAVQAPVKTPPKWLMQRPLNTGYYIGISRVSKSIFPNNYSDEARKKALDDLSNEIEVKVEANSIFYTFSTNDQHKEDFVQSIKLKSEVELEGYELVDSYESATEYAVYYRLNKAEYLAKQKALKDKRIQDSKTWRNQAQEAAQVGNWKKEVGYRLNALESVSPYFDQALKTEVDGKEVFYGNLLIDELNKSLAGFSLTGNLEQLRLAKGVELGSGLVEVSATTNGKPLTELELVGRHKALLPAEISFVTDQNGKAQLAGVKSKKAGVYNWVVQPNWQKEFKLSPVMQSVMAKSLQRASYELKLNVEPPRVSVAINSKSNTNLLQKNIHQAVQSQQWTWVANSKDADLQCKITLTERQGGEFNDLYTMYIGVEVQVSTATNPNFYFKKFTDLKGVDLNYSRATEKALDSFGKKFKFEVLPAIRRKLER
jgi:hypothetical protein